MNLQLSFPIQKFSEQSSFENKHLFIGSCFAENIGQKMKNHKFDVHINPNGILYNPKSILNALEQLLNNTPTDKESLFFTNEQWNSWEHHSSFSLPDKEAFIKRIDQQKKASSAYLKQANWLIVTFGAAYIYKHINSGRYVGNCHKVPQQQFSKHLLSTDEIVEEYSQFIHRLKIINPNANILFTVSPVRYIRDGIIENNRSKARLNEAVHQLVDKHQNAFYFPAYEIVMDELRDYRFFKEDLVHPSEQAINYVFNKLTATILNDSSLEILEEIKKILSAKKHRPLNPTSTAHVKFKQHFSKLCKELMHANPAIDLQEEINFFEKP